MNATITEATRIPTAHDTAMLVITHCGKFTLVGEVSSESEAQALLRDYTVFSDHDCTGITELACLYFRDGRGWFTVFQPLAPNDL